MSKRNLLIGIFFMGWFLSPFIIHAQTNRQASLEGESLGYFQKQDYPKALEGYRKLLGLFPKDPWYNYYAGVCLTELKQEPGKAIYRLKTASLGKDIPVNVYFYLGKAYYQVSRYQEAIDYFSRFRKQAGAAGSKTYYVDKWITQSRMYMNNTKNLKTHTDTIAKENDYQHIANKALEYQHAADSVRAIAYQQENKLRSSVDDERALLQEEISRLNKQAESFQKKADEGFVLARKYEKKGEMNPPVTAQNYQAKAGVTKIQSPQARISGVGPSPFLELTGDDFYRQQNFRRIFKPEDLQLLEKYHHLNLEGNQNMKDAWVVEHEIGRQRMIINTSTKQRERKKAQQKIDKQEEQKMAKRLKAVLYFQQANDGEYAVNNKYIESFDQLSDLDAARKKQGERYKREASVSHNRAMILRKKASDFMNYSSKYGLLMEANAYELTALDNQRKAIATYAGLIPARGETDMVHASVIPPAPSQPTVKQKKKAVAVNKIPPDSSEKSIKGNTLPLPETSPGDARAIHEKRLSHYVFGFTMNDSIAYPSVKDIPKVNALPPGVNYRIQVGVFKNPPEVSYFKGMYPMVIEKMKGKNLIRFYAGLFRTYGAASSVLLGLRSKGYKDAIIVGFYNGKRASVSRIQWLEDEEPYTNIHPELKTQVNAMAEKKKISLSYPMEKGVLFRVQLGVFSEPLPLEKLKELERYTEKDYVVIRSRNNQGLYVYAVGNFTTFEEAKNFRNKLAERGVSGCFVTAYQKGNRVPLSEVKGI